MANDNFLNNRSGSGPSPNAVDLKTLNSRHIRSTDKFYRIYAGAASEITAFESGTIYLAITVDDRQEAPFEEIVSKIARSWLNEQELKNASRYVAVVFQTNGRLGASVNPRTATPDQIAQRIVKLMRPVTRPDVPIAVMEGSFGDDWPRWSRQRKQLEIPRLRSE